MLGPAVSDLYQPWLQHELGVVGFFKQPHHDGVAGDCDRLTPARIEALVRKWLARLPHPFSVEDRAAGYRYDLSVLQAECVHPPYDRLLCPSLAQLGAPQPPGHAPLRTAFQRSEAAIDQQSLRSRLAA